MKNLIVGFILAGGLSLCISGFTKKGLPLSRDKHITGKPAKIIGAACFLASVVAAFFYVALANATSQ